MIFLAGTVHTARNLLFKDFLYFIHEALFLLFLTFLRLCIILMQSVSRQFIEAFQRLLCLSAQVLRSLDD